MGLESWKAFRTGKHDERVNDDNRETDSFQVSALTAKEFSKPVSMLSRSTTMTDRETIVTRVMPLRADKL